MENKEFVTVLKQIQACLKHEDWGNAKEYINLEIKKIKVGGDNSDM